MGQGALSKPVVQWWLSLNSSSDAAPSSINSAYVETSPRQALTRRVRIVAPSEEPASESGAAAERVGSKSPTWTPSQSPICTRTARPATRTC